MRKMYSENQVKEIVKKGVQDGEIPSLHIYAVTGTFEDDNEGEYSVESFVASSVKLTPENIVHSPIVFLEINLEDGGGDWLHVLNPENGWENDFLHTINENGQVQTIQVVDWHFNDINLIA